MVYQTSSSISQDDDDDDVEDEEGDDETALENYNTPLDDEDCEIDEYVIFKQVIGNMQQTNPEW